MDAGETQHSCHAAKTVTPLVSGSRPPGSHLLQQGLVYRLRHFWDCRACGGFGPEPGTHNKKGRTPAYVGHPTNNSLAGGHQSRQSVGKDFP